MPLPDLPALQEAGGWVIAVATLLVVLGLLVTGRLVAGPSHDREVRRGDAQDARLDTLTETVREQTSLLRTLVALMEQRRAR